MAANLFEDIVKFIRQSYTSDLATKAYIRSFADLGVKVSFGQGTPARVSWIAFLGFGQSVTQGIYPAYLFYKESNTLFLTYCISETNVSQQAWELPSENLFSINQYFSERGLGNPPKYGNSIVYKAYDIDTSKPNIGIAEDVMMDDLAHVIEQYKNQFESKHEENVQDSPFFNAITKFIGQAQTSSHSKSGYPVNYNGYDIVLSFDSGKMDNVVWMAFIGKGQSIESGIYPVFLYNKARKELALCYHESQNRSGLSWNFSGNRPETLAAYIQNSGGESEPYENKEYLYSIFPIDIEAIDYGLNKDDVMSALSEILSHFEAQFTHEIQANWVDAFVKDLSSANFMINRDMAYRFVVALITKPFVILTGLSGSGKTRLSLLFAEWLCESPEQYLLIPVGADWTNREPILGYPNALDAQHYVKPDSGVLDIIIASTLPENQNKPYFLIFDEMNLSHVERYFADFLSAMESKQKIMLHPNSDKINGIPQSISLGKNIFIIGTVNIDETTYMFSQKVLDRANVIEFRVTSSEMNAYLQKSNASNLAMELGKGYQYSPAFMESVLQTYPSNPSNQMDLSRFFVELEKIGAEFGYRTAYEINRFCSAFRHLDSNISDDMIMDYAIFQKLLPKVHGSRRKLEPVLRKMIELCVKDISFIDDILSKKKEYQEDDSAYKYPATLKKILRMYWNMIDNGFTSFTEA